MRPLAYPGRAVRFPGSGAKLRQLPRRFDFRISVCLFATAFINGLEIAAIRARECDGQIGRDNVEGRYRDKRARKGGEKSREFKEKRDRARAGERERDRETWCSVRRIFQARLDRGNPRRGEEENGRGGGTDTTTYIQAIVLRTVYPGRLRHRSAQPQCRVRISEREGSDYAREKTIASRRGMTDSRTRCQRRPPSRGRGRKTRLRLFRAD